MDGGKSLVGIIMRQKLSPARKDRKLWTAIFPNSFRETGQEQEATDIFRNRRL